MSPIFEGIRVPEEVTSVKRTLRQVTEPLQVIPEEEELELELKVKHASKSGHPPSQQHAAQLELIRRSSPATVPVPSLCFVHRPSVRPSKSFNPLCAPVPPLSVSKAIIRDEFQYDLRFSSTQLGKKSEKPDLLVQRRRRRHNLMEDFKRTFPDGKVPDPFALSKEECAYAA